MSARFIFGDFDDVVARGKVLYRPLKADIEKWATKEKAIDKDSMPYSQYTIIRSDEAIFWPDGVPGLLAGKNGFGEDDDWEDQVVTIQDQANQQENGMIYHWIMHPKGGIVILDIDKRKDHHVTKAGWHDMLFIGWKDLCAAHEDHATSNLECIWMHKVNNTDTIGIIEKLEDSKIITQGWTTLESSEDSFFALLRSPNGYFCFQFLVNFCDSLGRRIPSKVLVYRETKRNAFADICWILERVIMPPKPPSTPSKKDARKARQDSEKREKRKRESSSSIDIPGLNL